jgi:hypothetical protein
MTTKTLVSPMKALRTLRKTPAILDAILRGVTQEQATSLRDGPDGWSVLFIACHLRDLEEIFTKRATDILDHDNPTFAVTSNEELIRRNNYAAQDLRAALDEYHARRKRFIALLEALDDRQWRRSGTHPEQGAATLLDVAVNAGLHDVDHIEQILHCTRIEDRG